MKKFYLPIANLIFLTHLVVVVFISIGWLFPRFFYLYVFVVGTTLACWLYLGYCPATKWESNLRKKYGAPRSDDKHNLNGGFIHHYVHKIFGVTLGERNVKNWGTIFMFVALALSIILKLLSVF